MATTGTFTHAAVDTAADPVACTLGPGDQETRLAQWRELRRDGLVRERREGLVLTTDWRDHGDVAARLRVLIDAEQRCCGFLGFELEETGDVIRVRTVFPEGAESLLEVFTR